MPVTVSRTFSDEERRVIQWALGHDKMPTEKALTAWLRRLVDDEIRDLAFDKGRAIAQEQATETKAVGRAYRRLFEKATGDKA